MIERPHTENVAFLKKGNGEMAFLIDLYKWDATPLGSKESWPSELRNTINIMLHSSFPMFLYWGKELICFYNDAFRPSLGKQGKHPDILGMQGKDAWPEIWNTIEPLIMNVMYTGDSSLFEDWLIPIFRNGNIEDVFWTFGYTPVKDQDGQNQGVLVICNETTRKVNKFHKVVEQSKAPIAIFKGDDLIVEEANQATLDLWRLNRDVIGKPLLEVVPEMRDQGFADQLRTVLRTGVEQHGIEAPAYFKRDDGSTEKFFFNFDFSPFKEANGTITGVMVLSTDVTQQVVARNQLAIAEQEIRLSIEAADLGYWNYDPYTNCFNCNERTRELFNLPKTEHVDIKTVMNAVHPADADYVVPAFQNALKFEHAGKYNVDYRVIRVDKNDVLFVRAIGRAYFDNNKKPFRFSGTLQDITELKKAEESFHYRKALLEAQNNTIPDGILIVDTKGKILSFNKRFAEIWNMPQEIMDSEDDNLALQHAMGMMPDPELFVTRVNYLYSNFQEAAREEIKLKDGRVLERYGNAVSGEEGKRYGWAWYFRDITEKKKGEDKLRRSEEIYRSTFENAAVGIAHVDPEGKWLFVNDKLCHIFGYRRDELLTLRVNDLTHQDDIAADQNMIPQLIEGKVTSFNIEKRYIHKNTSIVWVDTSVSLVLDNYGHPEYFIMVIDDITQRIKAEEELRKVTAEQEELLAMLENLVDERTAQLKMINRELQRSNEDLQQFAHVASHDLKEPVRKIKTFSGRLKFELHHVLSEQANLYLDKIEHSVDRMYSMIDGVLMYSSLNALQQTNEMIDLNRVIQEIESDFELLIQQKKAIIRSQQLPSISGSGILIYQLFYNLIGNSLKFTRADVVPVIEISGESGPEQIKIVLKDNGIGFDQIYGERIFQTFSRLNPKDLFEGTGLGLTLCKNIVERHGGCIRAEGKENEGATFTIILPNILPLTA